MVQPNEQQSLLEKYGMPVSHLDFAYVSMCESSKELERILEVLLSGQEGYYPDLVRHTRDRLMLVKPRSRMLRAPVPVFRGSDTPRNKRLDFTKDIQEWINGISKIDLELSAEEEEELKKRKAMAERNRQARRGDIQTDQKAAKENKKIVRISSTDYAKWDSFDPDAEILKIDLEEEREIENSKTSSNGRHSYKNDEGTQTDMTRAELSIAASQQKERGNEYYRAGDYDEALNHYNRSIAYSATAVVYNNRAMTYLKLKNYEKALADCNKVLTMDPSNTKAMIRKAQALKDMKYFEEALNCLEELILIDPNNRYAQSMVGYLREFLGRNNSAHKVRLSIQDIKGQPSKSATEKMKVVVSLPGTSQGDPPYCSVMEVSPEKAQQLLQQTKITMRSNKKPIDLNEVEERRWHKSNEKKNSRSPKPLMISEACDTYELEQEDSNNNTAAAEITEENTSARRPNNVILQPLAADMGGSGEPHVFNANDITEEQINSPFEFMKLWQFVRNDQSLRSQAAILKRLHFSTLSTVISSKLDEPMLSTILRCFERHFTVPTEVEHVGDCLIAISRLPRFNIAALFMGPSGCVALKNVISFLDQHGFQLPEDIYVTMSNLATR